VFQVIALVTLAVPAAGTWYVAPRLLRALGSPSALVALLVVLLTLLVLVVGWAVALLPLRRRSAMPTFAEELAAKGAASFPELVKKSQRELHQLAGSADPAQRRRYHLRMAAGGLVVGVAFGVGTMAMVLAEGPVFVFVPVAAVAGIGLATYHAGRAVLG
jgi:hypothetical protein